MPSPSGLVYLCKNALIDNDYNHTIDFKSSSEQLNYWSSLVKYSTTNVSYIRPNSQYIDVPYKLDDLRDINYLYFKSDKDARLYYCFVTDKSYVNEESSRIYYTIDVLQTYMFDYKVNQSYVVQEHCDRWDANHKPIYSRTDEGLDYGTEYTIESAFKIKADDLEGVHTGDEKFYIVLCKDHKNLVGEGDASEPTQIDDMPNPYVIYLVPGTSLFVKVGGEAKLIANSHELSLKMADVGLGDYIHQITLLPYLPFKYQMAEVTDGSITYTALDINDDHVTIVPTTLTNTGKTLTLLKLDHITAGAFTRLLAEMDVFNGIEEAMPTEAQWNEVKANPYTTERDKRFESKLLTHPYRYNLLTDFRSQPAMIKNEHLSGDKIKVNMTSSLGFNAPYRYWIEGYKKDPEGRNTSVNQSIQFDYPVMSDAYQSYMLQNRNQISANQSNAIASGISGAAQGLVGGALFGGMGGAIQGALSGGINSIVSYQNMMRSENAKQSDIKNLPDSIMGSNESAINVLDKNTYLTFYRFKICCEFEELLADTFNMTGYTIKRVKVPNLRTRARYNYVKTIGANVVGSFNQDDLRTIRNIFDKGVTFWHYNDVNFKFLDYSLENIETSLL